jgi:rhodanese-related sulfurtransferase
MKDYFSGKGFYSHGVLNLTPAECYSLCLDGAILVDVRETYLSSFKMIKLDKVIYLPYSNLIQEFSRLPSDTPVIFVDSVGLKSREGVLFMQEQGYDNIANAAGGIVDWERDGLPVTSDISYRLSGSCMCQLKAREKRH